MAHFVIEPAMIVRGDAQLLQIALENLLGNAWKFSAGRAPARIEFGRGRHEGQDAYFVRDNGAGFDMAHADQLFRAFQRLNDASQFPGTGIGLATVQRIINKHGGCLWAAGEVGKGAPSSEENTSERQSLMRISSALFCLQTNRTNPIP